MNLKMLSKNNMGIIITFILVILFCQARFFDILVDTYLGRIVLIASILFVAYTSKLTGLVAVLAFMVAFNYNESNTVYSYNFYEGFDASGNVPSQNAKDKAKAAIQTDLSKNLVTASTSVATTTSDVTPSSSAESFRGREGFCMTDRESTILKGKQSNSVPVFSTSREQSDDVMPSDKGVFGDNYAQL